MSVRLATTLLHMKTMADSEVAVQSFIKANNEFCTAIYKEILQREKRTFLVSPLSAEIVLALAQAGCKDETAQEIRTALCLPDDEHVELGIKSFLPLLQIGEEYTVHIANKLYIKNKFAINQDFEKTASDIYQSDLENIDFEQKEKAAETINNWVEEKTNNKIKQLFSPKDFNKCTRVIIVNALYFKADWLYTFFGEDTDKSDFYITSNETVKVDMMKYYPEYFGWFNYHESKDLNAQFLELPFKNEAATMVIVLPREREGLADLENQIDKVFASFSFAKTPLNIAVPKFKIESKINFEGLLKNLGIEKAFDEYEADLSGIAGDKGDLIISAVVQKTFIDVNENGVEAAAASFVGIEVPCSESENSKPKNFIADHPFIFYIKIKNAIVFAGRVTNPVQ